MTESTLIKPIGSPLWSVRRATWFLVAIHLPFVLFAPLLTITRRPGMPAREIALLVLAGAALGGLQLRHSLAAARGERPRAWPWTFAALLVLAYLPGWWFAYDWILECQWFVLASAAMLLPRRAVVTGAAVVVVGTVLVESIHDHRLGFTGPQVSLIAWYYLALTVMGPAALYGSARLVRILESLFAARTELAEQALARERLRMSRDLHDLLGQSLSAVSLKGDLAIRLLPSNPPAARREIESLTSVARSALRDMRAVARDEHDVSLRSELDSAGAVLAAAGVQTSITAELPGLAPPLEAVLAWAVREGVTNILRHSQAETCSIAAGRSDSLVWLEIINDGAGASAQQSGSAEPSAAAGARASAAAETGSGLAGLAARAAALGGLATGERTGRGQFRLSVELPEGAS
jgi:two-component system, NarL family, sensor histidine kinase DesK